MVSLLLSFDTLQQNKIYLHPISRHATVKKKEFSYDTVRIYSLSLGYHPI